MKIGTADFNNNQLSGLLHHKNESCFESLAVWGRRVKALIVSGKWLTSENIYRILSDNRAYQRQIPIVFQNAKVSSDLDRKINRTSAPIKPTSSNLPKILLDYLNERGNRASYNPQGKSIRERRPRLYEFFTNPKMTPTAKDYDFGLEDEFGVVWFDHSRPEDADFIAHFQRKYQNSTLFSQKNRSTRFANNDTFCALQTGGPAAKEMMRDIMIFGAVREVCRIKNMPVPYQEVMRSIF